MNRPVPCMHQTSYETLLILPNHSIADLLNPTNFVSLIFADFVYDGLITMCVDVAGSWQQNRWVMSIIGKPGATLVDFVSKLWTMSTTALQTIKDGVTSFVDGTKAAGSYIMAEVFKVILQVLGVFTNTLTDGLFSLLSAVFPDVTRSSGAVPTVSIAGTKLGFAMLVTGDNVKFQIDSFVINFNKLLSEVAVSIETLLIDYRTAGFTIFSVLIIEALNMVSFWLIYPLLSTDKPKATGIQIALSVSNLFAALATALLLKSSLNSMTFLFINQFLARVYFTMFVINLFYYRGMLLSDKSKSTKVISLILFPIF